MNNAFDTLPWWLAAFAALLVGGISAVSAEGDVWVILARSGIAFFVFWIVGGLVRQFLTRTTRNSKNPVSGIKKAATSPNEKSEPSDVGEPIEAPVSGEE